MIDSSIGSPRSRSATTRRTLLTLTAASTMAFPWATRPTYAASSFRSSALAQAESPTEKNQGGGFVPERLDQMHEAMAALVEAGMAPGLVTAISRGGEDHVDAIGMMDVEGAVPMRRDTIFRIASLTKPITAVAAMTLVEEAILRLDDPVDPWLPELADRQVLRALDSEVDDTVPAARPITLRDLLTFRLGYGLIFAPPGTYPIQQAMAESGAYPNVMTGQFLPQITADELMAGYGSLPLLNQPGEAWFYNSGSDILGVLLARVTGSSLGDVLQERIFAPLGMKNTAFSVPADQLDRLPPSYATNPATGEFQAMDGGESSLWANPPIFESGAGGLVSTADDLLAFSKMMLGNGVHGAARVLSRPTVELMTVDHVTLEQKARSPFFPLSWENHGWGFGVSPVTRRDDLQSIGAYGWFGGTGTAWGIDPGEGLIGIVLTQSVDFLNGGITDFWATTYAAIDG